MAESSYSKSIFICSPSVGRNLSFCRRIARSCSGLETPRRQWQTPRDSSPTLSASGSSANRDRRWEGSHLNRQGDMLRRYMDPGHPLSCALPHPAPPSWLYSIPHFIVTNADDDCFGENCREMSNRRATPAWTAKQEKLRSSPGGAYPSPVNVASSRPSEGANRNQLASSPS